MARLRDVASLVRSKNAGPFELTIDIMFPDTTTYRRVAESGAVLTSAAAREVAVGGAVGVTDAVSGGAAASGWV